MAGRPAVGPYHWVFRIQIVAKHGGGLIEAALPVAAPWHGVAEGEDGCL